MTVGTDEGWVGGPTILASTWRYRYAVAATGIVAAVGGWQWSASKTPAYQAKAEIVLTDDRNEGVFGSISRRDFDVFVPQQAQRIEGGPIVRAVAAALQAPEGEIERALEATGDADLGTVTVRAVASDPDFAAQIANAATAAYERITSDQRNEQAELAAAELRATQDQIDRQIATLRNQQTNAGTDTADTIQSEIDLLVRERVDLSTQIQQLLVDARLLGSGVAEVELASVPSSPFSPQPTRDAALWAILGLGLGAAGAYWRAGATASQVSDRHTPEEILGIPLLGTIPVYEHAEGSDTVEARLIIEPGPQEAYHFLLSSMLHELFAVGGTSVMITSANPGDGKTEVSLQLAAASMREGRHALLVDGDLRMRQLTRLAGADKARGLLDLPADGSDVERHLVRRGIQGDLQLPVLGAGTPDSGAAIRQPGIGAFFESVRDRQVLTIVDSAPILATADTTILAGHVDGLVLVIRKGIDRDILARIAERIRYVGCTVLGYVYVTPSEREHRGDADYGYGYGDGHRRGAIVAAGPLFGDIPRIDDPAPPDDVQPDPVPADATAVTSASDLAPEPAPGTTAESEPEPSGAFEPDTEPTTATDPVADPDLEPVQRAEPTPELDPPLGHGTAGPLTPQVTEHVTQPESEQAAEVGQAKEPEGSAPITARIPEPVTEPEPATEPEPEPATEPEPEPATEPEPFTASIHESEASGTERETGIEQEPEAEPTPETEPQEPTRPAPPSAEPEYLSWTNVTFTNDGASSD